MIVDLFANSNILLNPIILQNNGNQKLPQTKLIPDAYKKGTKPVRIQRSQDLNLSGTKPDRNETSQIQTAEMFITEQILQRKQQVILGTSIKVGTDLRCRMKGLLLLEFF